MEQIYTTILTSAFGQVTRGTNKIQTKDIIKKTGELGRAAIGVLKALNDSRSASRKQSTANKLSISEPFKFEWIKKSLILIFRHFYEDSIIIKPSDIMDLFTFSLIFGLSSNTNTQKETLDLISLVKLKTKDIFETPVAKKSELEYIIKTEDLMVVKLEREALEE